jgi:type IV pilus assembly protein PilW
MRQNMTNRYARGLTLIELMIGLALSLMVLGAAVSVFMGTKESFRLEENLSAMQENYRFIADRFNKDFSQVGYTGCAMPYEDNSPTVEVLVSGMGARQVIQGVEGGAGGSDSVTLTYAKAETGIPIVEGGADRESPLYVSQNLPLYQALSDNFSSGSPVPVTLLVGNCSWADIFMVTAVGTASPSGTTVGTIEHTDTVDIDGLSNTSKELSDIYGRAGRETASVFERTSVLYEIDTVGGVTGLYETRDGGAQQLVLDNVTDMEILYGIDSPADEDGNADNYQDWSALLRVSDITSVKIVLTMIVNQQNGVDVTRDYTFTIKLRDMGLDV